MSNFMRQLQSLAQGTNVTILVSFFWITAYQNTVINETSLVFKVINNTARVDQTRPERKPALGPSFALMTDTTLWLTMDTSSEDAEAPCRTIRVLRSESIVR